MKPFHINDARELGDLTERWDRLWEASDVTLPTVRLPVLESHLQSFSPRSKLHVAGVKAGSEIAAVLPLVTTRLYGAIPALQLPLNPWGECGTLLVNSSAPSQVGDCLIEQMRRLPGLLFDLQWVNDSSASWTSLLAKLKADRCRQIHETQFQVGVIEIEGDWDGYFATLSKGHRKRLKKALNRLGQLGTVRFERYQDFRGQDLRDLLLLAFQIEHRGWKGAAGTSVLSQPPMFDYYYRNASALAEKGLFELQMLFLDQRPIAFEYGYLAKRVYHSHKVSYDPDFAAFGPGQLLLMMQLKEFFTRHNVDRVDTLGPLNEATARWCNHAYSRSRHIVSNGSRVANALVGSLGPCRSGLRRLLRRAGPAPRLDLRPRPVPKAASVAAHAGVGTAERREPSGI